MDLQTVIKKKEEKRSEFNVVESEFREIKEIYRELLNQYKQQIGGNVELNDDVFEQGIIKIESQLDEYKSLVMMDLDV